MPPPLCLEAGVGAEPNRTVGIPGDVLAGGGTDRVLVMVRRG